MLGGRLLSNWVGAQRSSRDRPSADRVARLDALGFSWNPRDEQFEERCAEYVAFREKHGHVRIGQHTALGNWARAVRTRWKDGTLGDGRLPILESIGFLFDPHEERWQRRLQELRAFKNAHGCFPAAKEGRVGEWVHNQRNSYKWGELSKERAAQLEALGVRWSVLDQRWEEFFAELVELKKATGSLSPPKGTPLQSWVSRQRKAHFEGKLAAERTARLEALGFPWDARANVGTKGAANPKAKLSRKEVLRIYADPRSYPEIAQDYGIHRESVGNIKRGISWSEGLACFPQSELQ